MSLLNPYSCLVDLKNFFYDKGFFQEIDVGIPVISVGNLNTGGSGKTPFIHYLAEKIHHISSHQSKQPFQIQKIFIVSKNYKAQSTGPEKVDLTRPVAARYYGDEPCLLKSLLTDVDVWSGPNKSQTALRAIDYSLKNNLNYQLALVDDGFSHRKLKRSLNIVLVDVSRPADHYQLLPKGFMREDWKTLRRADLIILTKVESLDSQSIQFFEQCIRPYNQNILKARYITCLSARKNIVLVTGLAHPQQLEKELIRQGFNIVDQKNYPDHYEYPSHVQSQLLQQIEKQADVDFVVTAKDYIKLQTHLQEKVKVASVSVQLSSPDERKLDECLGKVLAHVR